MPVSLDDLEEKASQLNQQEFVDETYDPGDQFCRAEVLELHEDGSEEWHKARSQGLGGSDAATVMGMKPYGNTRPKLWKTKTGRAEPFDGNSASRYGSIIEPFIRKYLRQRASDTPAQYRIFENLYAMEHQLRHPDREWMLGNTDGVILDDQGEPEYGVEIKTSKNRYSSFSRDVQKYHYPQIQHYMEVCGIDQWVYVYLEVPFDRYLALRIQEKFIEGSRADEQSAKHQFWYWLCEQSDVTFCKVDRDEAFIDRMVQAERDFWIGHIEEDEEPDEWMPDGEVMVDDDELYDLIDQYGRTKAKLNQYKPPEDAEDEKEKLKEQIKQKAQSIAAELDDPPKKLWLNDDDYILWHGGHNSWVAKPAERSLDAEDDDDDELIDVPF